MGKGLEKGKGGDKASKNKFGIPYFLLDKRFIAFALFIIAILIRILYKNAGVYHWDSLCDIYAVERMFNQGSLQYSYAYGAPGMVVLVFAVFYLHHLITGAMSAEFAYFFVTFVTAALCVSLIYLITEKFTKNNFVSISAALFFNFTPIFLSVTTYPKTHSIALFFALLSIYLMALFNEESKKRNKMLLLALSGFCLGYSVTIRIFSVLFALPLLLIYLNPEIRGFSFKIKKHLFSIKNALVFGIPAAAIWVLLFYKMIIETGGVGAYIKNIFSEQASAVGWQGFLSKSLVPSLMGIEKTMTILGVLLFVIGFIYGFKKYPLFSLMLALWLIPNFIYFANIAYPQLRFFIEFLPAIMIFMAIGSEPIYNKNKIIAVIVVAVVIGCMFYTAYPFISYRHNYSGTKETALWIASVTEPNAVIMSNDFGWFIEYYGKRNVTVHPRTGNDKEIAEFIEKLKRLYANGIPIYSTAEGFAIDPGLKVQKAILENFDVYEVGEHLNEIYQYSELEFRKYNEKLFRLVPKKEQANVTA
ncbi:MAG: glycosyltransferase family 39 protein [Candidatus Woesearchaeota archaeon]|nr:glycosyltransferase family 39 protein [Candidatus Woesearchaeota archaeon]